MKTLKLKANHKQSEDSVDSIIVMDINESPLATIHSDGDIIFHCSSKISSSEMNNITTVRNNFYLFFNNINC